MLLLPYKAMVIKGKECFKTFVVGSSISEGKSCLAILTMSFTSSTISLASKPSFIVTRIEKNPFLIVVLMVSASLKAKSSLSIFSTAILSSVSLLAPAYDPVIAMASNVEGGKISFEILI